ncbi:MAG TPA: dihydrolipoyl dehydrogenase [Bdellovibrionota bacterium]|jgi:dihydrolipoamide dehydrogenase|nr:dihydrolipoyl dehydrogenase [Bdellovibrionota bacterium]
MSSNETNYDLVIIGGGPGGYICAFRAAQLGKKVALIEKRKTFGGTCLNVGCIPSKALLDSSERYYYAKTKFAKHGILTGEMKVDLDAMMKRKEGVVRQLTNGIASLFKKHKIDTFEGLGSLEGVTGPSKTIAIKDEAGAKKTISALNVVIATGSTPVALKDLPFDGQTILSSTEALELKAIPQHLVVVGGGVIGLEMGSVWARLGAKVTVIEFADSILPSMDRKAAAEFLKILKKQDINFELSTKCVGFEKSAGGQVTLKLERREGGEKLTLSCDKVLVATGRKPFTEGLGLEKVGVKLDDKGRVEINDHFETNVKGVYAIGDVVRGAMLAHKAEEEGVALAETLAGQLGHVNYNAIPSVVYTHPEFATVGYTEEELTAKGIKFRAGQFPFMANAKAKAMEETDGFVKVLADEMTDRVLGVHIVGPHAADIIAEATAVIEFAGAAEDIARICHSHPTLSESLKEAALAVDKRTLSL